MNQEERDFICTGSITPICPECLEKISILRVTGYDHKCEYCGEGFTVDRQTSYRYTTKKKK